MKKQFTPGPWIYRIEDHEFCDTGDVYTTCSITVDGASKYDCLAEVFTRNDDVDEAIANTFLISAAPDLYNALKNLKECLESYFGKTEKDFFEDCDHYDAELYFAREYNEACNALKKARGEK